mmetsp:Transcript_6879/g.20924  ORF Transcript_6879/g.20924 Transcript_6879/m.20924 type:complete len:248 (+) Transcript_6879:96-839(+)
MFGLKAIALASNARMLQRALLRGPVLRGPLLGGVRFCSGHEEPTRLFLGNLSFVTNDEHVRSHFRDVDGVTDVVIFMRDGRSKGCGLIEFETRAAAEEAMHKYNETNLMGRTIFLREDLKSYNAKISKDKVVHLSNLPPTAAWQELKDIGRLFGKVARADVVNIAKGVGIIIFESAADALNAAKELQDFKYNDYKLQARVSSKPEGRADHQASEESLEESRVDESSDDEGSDGDIDGAKKSTASRTT